MWKIKKLNIITKITLVLSLVMLLAGGSYVVFADTAGPSVSDFVPAPGSTTGSTIPLISLRFYDPDQLNPNVILKIDGQDVTPVITWDGIFQTYEDSCGGGYYTVRVGDDYTRGVISYRSTRLSQIEHNVFYRLTDKAGNATEGTYSFMVNDSQGPQIIERSPLNASTVTTGMPAIMVKLRDDNRVDTNSVQLMINGVTAAFPYDPISQTATYRPAQPMSNGLYTVTFTVRDEFDNTTSDTWSFTVSDNSPPTFASLTPANGGYAGTQTPAIGAAISDPSMVVSPVALQIDGSTFSVDYDNLAGTVSYIPAAPLGLGQHTVSIAAYDFQGNGSTATWSFTVDQAGPVLTNFAPAPDSTVGSLKPQISFKFSDMAQLDANVSLSVDGRALTPAIAWDGIYATYEDSCGGGYYTVRVGNDYTKGSVTALCPILSQGLHTLQYSLKDKLGNTTSGTLNFTISDTTGPYIASSSPADTAVVATGFPIVSVTLADANRIIPDTVAMTLNGGPLAATYDEAGRTITYNVTQPLLNGTYTVGVTAEDELNNLSNNTLTFTVADVVPPVISGMVPANDAVVYGLSPTIQAAISDASGIRTPVYMTLDSSTLEIPYNSSTGIATYIPGVPLDPGLHTVTMAAYDNQGQQAAATWSFTIDRMAPELTVVSPASDENIASVSPRISVRFYDPSGFDAVSLKMKLDNVFVTPAVEYDGIYETRYDSCGYSPYQVRVGDDPNRGVIAYQAANLENQRTHTVEVFVYDKLGNNNHHSWSFTVHDNVLPEITALTPAPGSVLGNNLPTVSAKVTDNNRVDPQKVFMTLNGNAIGTFDNATGVISFVPARPIPDGDNTVVVAAYDIFGNQKTVSWIFTTRHVGSPAVTNLLPPPGTGTRGMMPTISANIVDDRGIDFSKLNLTLDGAVLPVNFKPDTPGSIVAGQVYALPPSPLTSAMHEVVLTVVDLSGNINRKVWSFGVNQFGDMGAGTTCTNCHTEGIAAIEQRHVAGAGDCGLCHTLTPVGWEPDCCYCHGHDSGFPPPIGNYACETCHNSSLSYAIPTHGSPNELSLHNNTAMGQDCKSCHSAYLTREHNLYVEGTGVIYTCKTCHNSTKPAVADAIAANNRSCSACHPDAGVGHEQVHVTTMPDGSCVGCHAANISQEHVAMQITCISCHQSTNPKVQKAISDHNTQCTACHQIHTETHADNIGAACQSCHSADLSADHIANRPAKGLNCATCHNSPQPAVAQSVYYADKNCGGCHITGHQVNLATAWPASIPVYQGFVWSTPIPAKISAGEPWRPMEFSAGEGIMILSDRRTDVTGEAVAGFYNSQLPATGWVRGPETVTNYNDFKITFTNHGHYAVIIYSTAEVPGTGTSIAAGGRIQIFYK